MAKLAYVRVSTIEQNEARQLETLQRYVIDKWYVDKASGKNTNRPQLKALLDYAREGDTIYIDDFSRLARSTMDLLQMVQQLQAKKIELVSVKESIDTSTATGKLMLTMIGAINEFERQNLLERQREGIAIAKREGKYKGRKPKAVKDIATVYSRYMTRGATKAELARELKLSRPTLDKLFKAYMQSSGEA